MNFICGLVSSIFVVKETLNLPHNADPVNGVIMLPYKQQLIRSDRDLYINVLLRLVFANCEVFGMHILPSIMIDSSIVFFLFLCVCVFFFFPIQFVSHV